MPLEPAYDCDTRFIPAHHQPVGLIDLARSRAIDTHRLLKGCGLFYEDIVAGQARMSPTQFLRLIANAQRLIDAPDTSFLCGQRMWPGHYGPVSQLLEHADHLGQAIGYLRQYRALLSPLLTPEIQVDEKHLHLYWRDSCGAGELLSFVIEATVTAVVSLARRLQGTKLPWHFQFAYPEPVHVEQYWVHLGETVAFDRPSTVISLPREYLHSPWPGAGSTAGLIARQTSAQQLDVLGGQASFLDQVHDYLKAQIRTPLNLERVSAAFETSPASFKRRLKKHDTTFQEQLDQVRREVALYLYQMKGYSNEEVAQYLGFNDITNFRRSFKRWTGLTPSSVAAFF